MKHPGIILFEEIIVGTFNNVDQVNAEIDQGGQIHPFAVHITEVINHRLDNLPEHFDGTFILEESYYTYPDSEMEVKPLIFKVTPKGEKSIFLESMVIPDHLDKLKVVNSNPDLRFDYLTLKKNEAFGTASYNFSKGGFIVDHLCDFGDGVSFNLIERLEVGRLHVMELVKKDGVRITPYEDPIIYVRTEL